MRNPWVQEHYTGPFRDDDPQWTDEWKTQVDLKPQNDGIFWMEYDTYLKYFWNTGVALYDNYAAYHQLDFNLHKNYTMFTIKNPVTQHLYITPEQYSNRHYPRAEKCNPNNSVWFYLFDKDWNSYGRPSSAFPGWAGFGTMGNLDKEVPAGDYVLYVGGGPGDFALNFYYKLQNATVTMGQ